LTGFSDERLAPPILLGSRRLTDDQEIRIVTPHTEYGLGTPTVQTT
jgi:hypothetical protein